MTTSNIISTPNITGNIGSCTLNSNTVTTSATFFTSEKKVTQLNSCTGKIISVDYYTDYSGVWGFDILGVILLGIIAFIVLI